MTLARILEIPDEIELLSDPSGEAGRNFGVARGFLPDNDNISPYVKLFGMVNPPIITERK